MKDNNSAGRFKIKELYAKLMQMILESFYASYASSRDYSKY